MSCLTIPEWRYIELTEEQREKLTKVNVENMVQVWNQQSSPSADRVWLLRQEIQVSTFIDQTVNLQSTVSQSDFPPGFLCMQTPPEAHNLLCETNVALGLLFEHLKHHKLQANPQTKLTMFNRIPTHSHVASPKEILGFLKSKPEFEVIHRFWLVYINELAQHFRLSVDQFICGFRDMHILQYDDLLGFGLHIDNLLRADATVFNVGVGRPVVYDMTRVLGRNQRDEVSIIRSSNPEGTMMVLDGESRYKWAHGIPTHNGVKYTLVIRLANTARPVRLIGKCIELNTDMYSIGSSTEPESEMKTPSNHHETQNDSLLGLLMRLANIHN